MKIAITGATGFVGRPLVKRLLAAGHRVTALTRDVERATRLLPFRCACEAWSATGDASEIAALRGAEAVIHLAGENIASGRLSASRKAAIYDSRVLGTRTLVRAIGLLPPGERPRVLLSASAVGYYGDRGGEELDERSGCGEGFLAELCRAWEEEASAARALGVRTAVIRVGIVLGKGGGALASMLPPFRLGLGGRLGSGNQWMSWIHLDDLLALFEFALANSEAGAVLAGVAPAPVTNAEFTRQLGVALGRPTFLPAPAVALRVALGEMAYILLAGQRVLPRDTERLGFAFRHRELAGALAALCDDHVREIEHEQWVPRRPEEVFPFFADARNLEKLTPDSLRFRVLRVSTPAIRAGTRIDYRLSLHGVPFFWRSRIDDWQPSRRFVDTQVCGPYRLWHHTHEFEPCEGGTLVRDRVRYELPLGALGELAAGRLVERDLEGIFAFRRKTIRAIFG